MAIGPPQIVSDCSSSSRLPNPEDFRNNDDDQAVDQRQDTDVQRAPKRMPLSVKWVIV
jgi:hypothetical protein